METYTGWLLLAVPREISNVDDVDIFDRSVVLLLHHDEDGAHGIVLNRPLDAGVDTVLPGWQQHVVAPDRLFQGGPVGLDSAIGLASQPGDQETVGVRRLFRAVALVDLDAPPAIVIPELTAMRVFAGYSGWGSGQLEAEIDAGLWWVVEAESADAFTQDPATLWYDVVRRQGGDIAHALTFPRDISLN